MGDATSPAVIPILASWEPFKEHTLGHQLWHKKTDLQKHMFVFMEHASTQVFLVGLLLLSLFMTDAWTLGNQPNSNDDTLHGVLLAVFIIFCMECISLTFCQKVYVSTIFFYLDVLGTISIIIDIPWIAVTLGIPDGAGSSNGAVLRSTRAAKLGTRYGRLLRILKLTRFLRYLPCLRRPGEEEKEPVMSQVRRVTSVLIAKLSQNVAAVIMILVIIVPFLVYNPQEASPDAWLQNLKLAAKLNTTTLHDINMQVERMHTFYSHKDMNLMRVEISSPYVYVAPASPKVWTYTTRPIVRKQNQILYKSKYKNPQLSRYFVSLTLDTTQANQQEALYSILLIILVIVLLCSISTSLQVNVEKFVITPLEKMTARLMILATDMLKAWKATVKADSVEQQGDDDDDENLEDLLLEKMIEKISRLVDLKSDKHNQVDLENTENIDADTKTWLKKQYTSPESAAPASEYAVELVGANSLAEETRLQELLDSFKMVDVNDLDSWDFDVLEHTHEELYDVFGYIFGRLDVFNTFRLSKPVYMAFMAELASKYVNTNTYHNFRHGCDVGFTVWRLLTLPGLEVAFSHLEMFAIVTAALAHDVGHPGVNNVYLVKSKHPLAINHNDRSPLENFHCVELYTILSRTETNIFAGLSDGQWRDARKIILHAILGTDMTNHFKQIADTKIFGEQHSESIHSFCLGESTSIECLADEKNRLFLLELCLHCADISNPFKTWTCCEKWAHLVVEEFCAQGDRERSEGLEISPMCDRATMNLCNSQLGFIEFVVSPLIVAFVSMFPPLHEVGENVSKNFTSWCERRKLDILADASITDKEGEMAKVDARAKALADKFSFTEAHKAKMTPAAGIDAGVSPSSVRLESKRYKRVSIMPGSNAASSKTTP